MNSEYCNEKLDAGHYCDLKGYQYNFPKSASQRPCTCAVYQAMIAFFSMPVNEAEHVIHLQAFVQLNASATHSM